MEWGGCRKQDAARQGSVEARNTLGDDYYEELEFCAGWKFGYSYVRQENVRRGENNETKVIDIVRAGGGHDAACGEYVIRATAAGTGTADGESDDCAH